MGGVALHGSWSALGVGEVGWFSVFVIAETSLASTSLDFGGIGGTSHLVFIESHLVVAESLCLVEVSLELSSVLLGMAGAASAHMSPELSVLLLVLSSVLLLKTATSASAHVGIAVVFVVAWGGVGAVVFVVKAAGGLECEVVVVVAVCT